MVPGCPAVTVAVGTNRYDGTEAVRPSPVGMSWLWAMPGMPPWSGVVEEAAVPEGASAPVAGVLCPAPPQAARTTPATKATARADPRRTRALERAIFGRRAIGDTSSDRLSRGLIHIGANCTTRTTQSGSAP